MLRGRGPQLGSRGPGFPPGSSQQPSSLPPPSSARGAPPCGLREEGRGGLQGSQDTSVARPRRRFVWSGGLLPRGPGSSGDGQELCCRPLTTGSAGSPTGADLGQAAWRDTPDPPEPVLPGTWRTRPPCPSPQHRAGPPPGPGADWCSHLSLPGPLQVLPSQARGGPLQQYSGDTKSIARGSLGPRGSLGLSLPIPHSLSLSLEQCSQSAPLAAHPCPPLHTPLQPKLSSFPAPSRPPREDPASPPPPPPPPPQLPTLSSD